METNVVVARFTGYATVTDMRYRWDYGQKLKVEGIADLPDYFEVHFSNAPSVGTAKVWLGQNGVVDIPDEYLATGEPVYAWIFLHAGETDGETVYSILIPVKKRPKPVNDAPTPVQKSELDTAIAILQTASATATEQATIATGAATTATGAVADVEAAATRAEQAADGAEASATDAQAAAMSAELSAQTAQSAKSAAETAAANAEQSATDAGNYAGLAEAAEQDAQAAKTAAEASATAAAASETAAQTAQTVAEAAKDTAVANATTATTKAAEAAQSASSAADSETAAEAAATRAEQAAASLTVDSALSETSENPVQNKVVTGAVADLKSALDETNRILGAYDIGTVYNGLDATYNRVMAVYPINDVNSTFKYRISNKSTNGTVNIRITSSLSPYDSDKLQNVATIATSATYGEGTFTINDAVKQNARYIIILNVTANLSVSFTVELYTAGSLTDDINTNGEAIGLHDASIKNLVNGKTSLRNYTFVHGTWYTRSVGTESYRIRTSAGILFDYPCTLTCNDGYMINVYKCDADGSNRTAISAEWVTSCAISDASLHYAINVKRATEDTNEYIEDVQKFADNVKYPLLNTVKADALYGCIATDGLPW